jgi:hypothetical protein
MSLQPDLLPVPLNPAGPSLEHLRTLLEHALRYEFDLEPRDFAQSFDHVDAIESAWHSLQQYERRSLRLLKSPI